MPIELDEQECELYQVSLAYKNIKVQWQNYQGLRGETVMSNLFRRKLMTNIFESILKCLKEKKCCAMLIFVLFLINTLEINFESWIFNISFNNEIVWNMTN